MNNLAEFLILKKEEMPNKICLADSMRHINYKNLYNSVVDFSEYLKEKGIKKNDKILVLVPMSIELYVTLISLWTIGAIPCFMDAGFIRNNLNKNNFDDITGIIGITKYLLYASINSNLKNVHIKVNSNKVKIYPSCFKKEKVLKVAKLKEDFPALYTYTSGTTGTPKVLARSHEFLLNQAEILAKELNYGEYDRELSSVPIFTLSNIYYGISTFIADGNYTDLGKSNAIKLVNQIQKDDINRIMAAPGLLNVIVNYCLKNNIKLEKVTKVFSGGGAIFLDFIYRVKQVFPSATIVTMYGSSEAEPIATMDVTKLSYEDIESTKCGKGILAGNIVGVDDCSIIKSDKEVIGRIDDQTFNNMKTDIGEIVVTGSNVLKHYVKGIGDKENKFKVGDTIYHRTGDMGCFDDKGRLWLKGRLKEPYFNVEAAIHARFNIGKTACFKHNDKLYLVFEKKDNIDKQKIFDLIDFEKIDEIIFVDYIPVDKRHSTKVDYKKLKEMIK
jgi:acyl-CoA synthetase (AMP-forming)/AMP-acid ligase II